MYYRGDIWLIDLEPVVGHEQGEKRPAVIISDNQINNGPSGLVTVVPITKATPKRDARNIPVHLHVKRGTGGLVYDSYILCDQIRTISRQRLIKPYENVDSNVMARIEECLRVILSL